MSASSLIFVVIFAVWAAYMLQHWVRRREVLATTRSVDRFSEAMRMLERTTPRKHDMTAERPRSILRPAAERTPQVESVEVPTATRVEPVARKSTKGGSKRVAGRLPVGRLNLSSPEVKVGILLASLAFFVLSLVLAPFGLVPAWLPLLGLVAVGGVVYWLRRTAVAARLARSASTTATSVRAAKSDARTREAAARAAATNGSAKAGSTAVRVDAAAAPRPAQAAAPVKQDAARPVETRRSPLAAEKVVEVETIEDVEPDTASVARAEAEVFDAQNWQPVSVPRPTYTMKAKAQRVEVEPAATVEPVAAPKDERPLAAQYANTPVDELPFDGMALDEDYDELPQVYRAG